MPVPLQEKNKAEFGQNACPPLREESSSRKNKAGSGLKRGAGFGIVRSKGKETMKREFSVGGVWLAVALAGVGFLLAAAEPVKAPEFRLDSLEGVRYSRSGLTGKIVYISFFQEGCRPCEQEVPVLNHLARKYPGKLQVLGVGYQTSDREKLKRTAGRMRMEFPALMDSADLAGKFGVWALPHGVLIDEYGFVVKHYSGFQAVELGLRFRGRCKGLRPGVPAGGSRAFLLSRPRPRRRRRSWGKRRRIKSRGSCGKRACGWWGQGSRRSF